MRIFHLPDLGEGLAEAEIHEWLVKEGDIVKQDQPMVSVETAKAVVEVPAPFSGKIVKLFGKAGDVIPTDSPLVEFADEDNTTRRDAGTVVGSLEESTVVLEEHITVVKTPSASNDKSIKATPAVRALAKALHIDLSNVTPTGAQGQVTVDDVKKAAEKATSHSGAESLRGVRRQMALVMTQSHREVVAVTIVDDADVTDAPADFTVFLLQAIAHAVKTEPALNALYDGEKMQRIVSSELNLGLAVDSEEGLFVPVIKNVEKKSDAELRESINHLKQAVKSRTLKPDDFQGATISLSNFGTIAGRYATPVIVPPAVAILGCGKMRDEVVVRDHKMVIRRIAPLSLTFDHRAATGGEASRFLAAVIQFLEKRS
ncbi:MAG: dihydrolipoamide acetyltransferase family protein [Gammaproteobacteria bacterium]|nr:dihydrolipoamide acetyltransferase family protein [Gammaproteobacteria bacterium]